MKSAVKIILLTAIFNLPFHCLNSQIIVTGSETLLAKLRLNEGAKGIQTLMYSDVGGNPFIYKDFRNAIVITNNGEKFETSVRFDIYANEMQFRDNNKIFSILQPARIRSIETDSIKFIYTGFAKSTEGPAEGSSYFIVGADGKCQLLIRKYMRVQDPESPKLYQDAKPAKFIPLNESYFLKSGDGNAVLIKNTKDILSVMGDQKVAVDKFIRTNKINIKKKNDIARVVEYYNTL